MSSKDYDKIPVNDLTRNQFTECFNRKIKERKDRGEFVVDKFTFLTRLLQKGVVNLTKFAEFNNGT